MEKKYRLKYKGKWMNPKHMLGSYVYELTEDESIVKVLTFSKANTWRNLISEENNISTDEIELIEV